MKLVIATPLYPPDVAEPAPYVKELAQRLKGTHDVTIVAYGRLPEPIEGVCIVSVPKDRPLPVRLWQFSCALRRAALQADAVIAENGASVELPLIFVSLTTRTPLFLHLGDDAAHESAEHSLVRHMIERIAYAHVKHVIEARTLSRPEVIPFLPTSTAEQAAYEASWTDHLAAVSELIHG